MTKPSIDATVGASERDLFVHPDEITVPEESTICWYADNNADVGRITSISGCTYPLNSNSGGTVWTLNDPCPTTAIINYTIYADTSFGLLSEDPKIIDQPTHIPTQ
jgi:hypothetical protein